MEQKEYYIAVGNEQKGPFSVAELNEKGITKSTLVWKVDFENWVEACTVEELKPILKNIPPPLPEKDIVEIRQLKEGQLKKERVKIITAKEIKYNLVFFKYAFAIFIFSYLFISILRGGYTAFYYKEIYNISDLYYCDQNKYYSVCIPIEKEIKNLLPYNERSSLSYEFWKQAGHSEPIYSEEDNLRFPKLSGKENKELLENVLKNKPSKKDLHFDLNDIPVPIGHTWVIDDSNYSLNKYSYEYTLSNILKRSYGWDNLKLSILISVVSFPLLMLGRYAIIAARKSKEWVEINSKK